MSSTGRALLQAGRVGAPHGLDGSFHVIEARPALLVLGAPVTVHDAVRVIERRAGHDRGVILRLEGCEARADAAALRGAELLVPRDSAPALGPDEWWAEELEGCSVRAGDVTVGVVQRLLALPSCEILEVRREDGSDLLVPLVADAVRSVDVQRREIEIDLEFLGEG